MEIIKIRKRLFFTSYIFFKFLSFVLCVNLFHLRHLRSYLSADICENTFSPHLTDKNVYATLIGSKDAPTTLYKIQCFEYC